MWQLERRAWKLDLIARVEARVNAAPQPPPPRAAWPHINRQADEYRRVGVRGEFLPGSETYVQALTDFGAGYWVLTPLRTAEGVVIINRGFVPAERRKAHAGPFGAPGGLVTITGLLRISEPSGGFLRANDPAAERWYSRDVAAIAQARGLSNAAPFFIDAEASPNVGAYPMGGLTVVHFRNAHLAYALTWFGLAGLCGAGAFLVLKSGRDATGEPPRPKTTRS